MLRSHLGLGNFRERNIKHTVFKIWLIQILDVSAVKLLISSYFDIDLSIKDALYSVNYITLSEYQ